jgi:hypothetical protein
VTATDTSDMDISAVPDASAGPAATLSVPSVSQGAAAGAGVPGWWHGPDGTQPPVPGSGSDGAGPAVPVVWGGLPAWGWGRPDSEAAQGGTAPARTGSRLGVRVDPRSPAPALGGPGQGGLGLGGSGRGGRPGEPGQNGPDRRRRRQLLRVVRDWFFGPLHEQPDPIPAWLARLLLRWWPAQAGQEEATGTDSAGGSGAGVWAGTAVAVRGGGAR